MATCYRHPNRETGVSCANCGRPICPDCMTPTSVGMRCPECAKQRTQVRRPVGPSFGGFSAWSGGSRWSVTNVLIAINVVVFVLELATGLQLQGGNSPLVSSIFDHGALLGVTLTAHNPYTQPAGFAGTHEYWRLLTSGFLHESLIHIALNMISLWLVGRVLEPAVGRWNFLAIYMSALFAGSFGALAFTPAAPTAGASGAIFGIFGAFAYLAYRRGIPLIATGIVPMLAINLIYDLTVNGISIGAHIGGLIAGLIGGYAFVELCERRRQPAWAFVVYLLIACVSVVGALLVAGGSGIAPHGLTI